MTKHKRVLLIDDDPEDAQVTAIALRKASPASYRLHHVETLADGVAALHADRFDVVLLDLGLPGSNGIETLEEFRAHHNSVPVVVLSGLEDEEMAMLSLERGAQDYLFKNAMDARMLSRAIRYAIQRQTNVLEIEELLARTHENEAVLKRKNERLKELYETAHAFVDNVSHEFRTPLTVIKEYTALVSDGTMGAINDEQRRFLSVVEDRANDLNTMVDDMLDVSRLGAGLLGVCRKPHDIRQIVERVLPSLQHKADVKGLSLDVSVPDDLDSVYCDGEKVERVIINLAVNAMKFTKPGGHVKIIVEQEAGDVVVKVVDDGFGIAPDKLQAIFERFEQVDSAVRNSTKGFGLGLSIAKELVDLNFGKLSVESEVGVGSTFSFTVPVSNPCRIARRYIDVINKRNCDTLSLLVIKIDSLESTDDSDAFLRYAVRANDLVFNMNDKWVVLLPGGTSEVVQFEARIRSELEAANRNRPRGPLPEFRFAREATWSQLSITCDEVVERIRSFQPKRQASFA